MKARKKRQSRYAQHNLAKFPITNGGSSRLVYIYIRVYNNIYIYIIL